MDWAIPIEQPIYFFMRGEWSKRSREELRHMFSTCVSLFGIAIPLSRIVISRRSRFRKIAMRFERTIREMLIQVPLHGLESFRRLQLLQHVAGQEKYF
jgi:hypothetical protein